MKTMKIIAIIIPLVKFAIIFLAVAVKYVTFIHVDAKSAQYAIQFNVNAAKNAKITPANAVRFANPPSVFAVLIVKNILVSVVLYVI
jgi:hypothetical protein